MSEETDQFGQIPTFYEGSIHYKGPTSVWKPGHLILRGDKLKVNKLDNKQDETSCGEIPLSEHTEVNPAKGKVSKNVQFEVRNEKKHRTKFKCETENERDLWVAFIDGIASGFFTKSINLTKEQIERVESAIKSWRMFNSQSHKYSDEGIGSEIFDPSFMNEGGPIKNHKFYIEHPGHPRNQQPPSWFFENCSRQLAELILEKGREYGNVLMRQSVTFKDNGSYVLSFRRDTPRGSEYEHFEVIQAAAGYQINVENVHAPKKCLKDVLDFFLEVAGLSYTVPLSTNDLVTIGIIRPFYQEVIQSVEPSRIETPQQPRTAHTRENKTWTHKQFPAASPPVKASSQTIGAKSAENPFRQKSCREVAVAPASLREVLRCRHRDSIDSEDEMFSTPIQIDKTTATPPIETRNHKTEGTNSEDITNRLSKLYATPRPKTSRISPMNNARPLPPIPIAPPAPLVSTDSTDSPDSTLQGTPGPFASMSANQRLSLRAPMPPPTAAQPATPTEPPPHLSTRKRVNYETFVPSPPPQSLRLQPSLLHVTPTAPPPPPLVPLAKASSSKAPAVLSHVAPPLSPPVIPSAAPPVAPPVAIPVPPPAPPLPSSAPTAPHLAKTPFKTHIKKVTIVTPPSPEQTSPVKLPKTLPKPKPNRRASEPDLHHPAHRPIAGPSNSEIIEEEHPSVRDVRAMFDKPSTSPSIQTKGNTYQPNERRHSTIGFSARKLKVFEDHSGDSGPHKTAGDGLRSSEYANTNTNKHVDEPIYEDVGMYQNIGRRSGTVSVHSPELGHPDRTFQQPPTTAPPPPLGHPESSVTAPPPPPHPGLMGQRGLASGEGKEDFKKRLEAMMGNVNLKSPVTSPGPPSKPLPTLPHQAQTVNVHDSDIQIPGNYENIYSEPVNQ